MHCCNYLAREDVRAKNNADLQHVPPIGQHPIQHLFNDQGFSSEHYGRYILKKYVGTLRIYRTVIDFWSIILRYLWLGRAYWLRKKIKKGFSRKVLINSCEKFYNKI